MGCEYIVALAGNPNTGKSTVFNSLTGLNQHTGNWAGKTVTHARGCYEYKNDYFILIDLPGAYSLFAHSADEEAARDFICSGNPQATVVVLDAACLERNLNLALQIMAVRDQVIVCVNLLDEATRKGIRIDLTKLGDLLGVPVIGTNARDNIGLEELKEVIRKVCSGEIASRPLRLHAADTDEAMVEKIMHQAEEICAQTVVYTKTNPHALDRKIDTVLTSKTWGIPIMLALLGVIFWITIKGANVPSGMLASGFEHLGGRLDILFQAWRIPDRLHGILLLGIYKTLTWVVAVMLPPMAIFFPLFTLLEDLGYLPRVAFNLDNYFKKCCAHGKQALTMCMGFGCNAAGVMSCRIIDSPRERLIAMITNNFVPCNGRFPTLIAIASIFIAYNMGAFTSIGAAFSILAAVVLGVGFTLLISRILSATILKGLPSSFTLELPPYRKPQIGRIIVRSVLDRTLFVLARAVVVAAPAGAVIWLMANTTLGSGSLLNYCAAILDPWAKMLGLDGFILLAFILGMPANEIVIPILIMSYLSQGAMLELESLEAMRRLFIENGWTTLTAVCAMLFALNHWPCATTLLTIKKETQSWKWMLVAFFVPTVTGILICFLVAQAARLLGLA
ncbi:MAG: ferrous iron transporter B [Clostridia bacterium]|jgi:ferrous iron transport protein B|nr:ferrous iron transporter B [Clostridia bacterium]